jgi:hypothetical protein
VKRFIQDTIFRAEGVFYRLPRLQKYFSGLLVVEPNNEYPESVPAVQKALVSEQAHQLRLSFSGNDAPLYTGDGLNDPVKGRGVIFL